MSNDNISGTGGNLGEERRAQERIALDLALPDLMGAACSSVRDTRRERSNHFDALEQSLVHWRRVRASQRLTERASSAWTQAVALAMERSSELDPIPMLTDSVPPVSAAPSVLGRLPIYCLDPLSTLGEMGLAGLSSASSEIARVCGAMEDPPVLVLPLTVLLGTEATPDSCAISVEFLARMRTASPRIVLLGTDGDASRLRRHRVRLTTLPVAEWAPPAFLRPPRRELHVGRAGVLATIIGLITAGRHVVVTGPAGAGKTALCQAVLAHPELRKHACYQLSAMDVTASTAYRGQFEARVVELCEWARQQETPPCIFLDELTQYAQRTGFEGHPHADSFLDLMKGELVADPPAFVALATATEKEFRTLTRDEPAYARRFSVVRIAGLEGAELKAAVATRAEETGATLEEAEVEQIVQFAPFVLPDEASPARELKLLHWTSSSGHHAMLDVLRDRFGELAAPRRDRLMESVEHLARLMHGRDAALGLLHDALEVSLKRLVTGPRGGPFLALVVSGPRGAGKTFFARSVAAAMGSTIVSEVPADPRSLAEFVSVQRGVPGGTVIVDGDRSAAGTAKQPPNDARATATGTAFSVGDALRCASALHRWLVILVLHLQSDDATVVEPAVGVVEEPMPTLWLWLRPSPVRGVEGLQLAEELCARLRERALSQGFAIPCEPPAAEELERLCADGPSPHQLESRLADLVLGTSAQAVATTSLSDGCTVIPLHQTGACRRGGSDDPEA